MRGARTIDEVLGLWEGDINADSPQARGLVCAGWSHLRAPFDISGRGNNGTLYNSATYAATERGWALSASAGTEKVQTATAANYGLALGATDPWSISFWHYTRAYVSLSQVWGYGKRMVPDTTETGALRYVLQFNNNYYFWGDDRDWDSGVAWDVGSWRLIEFVSTGSDLILYRDGVQAAARGSLPSLVTANSYITAFLGHIAAVSSPNMLLVDPRIYNVGHTAQEAMDLYQRPYDLFAVRRGRRKAGAAPAGGLLLTMLQHHGLFVGSPR